MIAEAAVSVRIHRAIQRLQHDVLGRAAGAAIDLVGEKQCLRRDAGADLTGHAQPGDDAGDLGSVAIRSRVQRVRVRLGPSIRVVVADEIVAADHLGGREGAGLDHGRIVGLVGGDGARAAEVPVGVVDAAVDDRHADPPAPRVEVAPDHRGADEGNGVRVGAMDGQDPGGGDNAGKVGQPRQQ